MANIKITDLVALTDPASTDVLPVVDIANDETKKVAVGEIVGKISGDVDVATDGTSSIAAGVIFDADVNASAAIAGTKIDPDFGSQTVETTGVFSAAGGAAATPSIAFTGDLNTGIYSPGADQVAISTNGTGRLFIDASGNVGVGGTPDNTFDVIASTNPIASIRGTAAGTSTAILKLEGYRTSGDAGRLGEISVVNTRDNDEQASIEIYADGDTEGRFLFKSATNSLLELGNTFTRFFSSNTERLRITSDGKLGLGTSSPGSNLTVVGGPGTFSHINGGNSDTDPVLASLNNVSVGSATYGWLFYNRSTDGNLRLARRDNSTTDSNVITILRSSGNVGIGTTGPEANLHVFKGESSGAAANAESSLVLENDSNTYLQFLTPSTNESGILFGDDDNDRGGITYNHSTDALSFRVNAFTRAAIDSSGRLLVGTSTGRGVGSATLPLSLYESTAHTILAVVANSPSGGTLCLGGTGSSSIGSNTLVSNNQTVGGIRFAGADGDDLLSACASISAQIDGTPGANDMPGRLVFSTTADGASSPTERMRITSQGNVFIDSTSIGLPGFVNTSNDGLKVVSTANTVDSKIECFATTVNTRYGIVFSNTNGIVGSISTNGSATAFNTSSDYRLKENVVPLTGAADRLNQLQVHRFNFIADPDTTVDGFLAHEAQAIVPECVTGTKDEVDADGNPVYQGIDQSKLVPLLTAALQEALAEIESLKARVTALEP